MSPTVHWRATRGAEEIQSLVAWNAAHIMTLMFSGLFYGLFVVLTANATFMLWRKQSPENWKRDRLKIAILLFMLFDSTVVLALTAVDILQQFVYTIKGPTGVGAVVITLFGFCFLQQLVVDGLLLFRVYTVYRFGGWQMWIVLPGALIWLGNIASSTLLLISDARLNGGGYIFSGVSYVWSTVYGSLSAAQNVFSSGLLLWEIERRRRPMGSHTQLGPALSVVIETGVVYSLWWIVGLCFYIVKSPIFLFFIYNFPHIAGSVAASIIVQVELIKNGRQRNLSMLTSIRFPSEPASIHLTQREPSLSPSSTVATQEKDTRSVYRRNTANV